MDVRITNEKTKTFWDRAVTATKFQKDGKWGLITPSGDLVLSAEYDQIEVCSDYIYAHYEERHTFFYKDGSTSDCADSTDDGLFYEKGKVGLLNNDGSILIPAQFDEIIEWGDGCDVIYVREGKEFHYLNHKLEPILKSYKIIPEDEYPEDPYSLEEDQNREVLICLEPAMKEFDDQTAFVCNQWCRLDRIPRKEVKNIFADCEIVSMHKSGLNFFYSDFTYIYSARKAKSTNEDPITTCVQKINAMGCYDADWSYLVKIMINHNTIIDNDDLYGAIMHYEEKYNTMRANFAIAYDDTLCDNEVCVFMVYYYTEGCYPDEYLDETLSKGLLDQVKEEFLAHMNKERVLDDAYWYVGYNEGRDWKETEKVLSYLKSIGCINFNVLIKRHIWINPYWIGEITPAQWEFKKQIIKWALSNGANINLVKRGKTLYDNFMKDLASAKEWKSNDTEKDLESIKQAEVFAEWLKSNGALTTGEFRDMMQEKLRELTPKQLIDYVTI